MEKLKMKKRKIPASKRNRLKLIFETIFIEYFNINLLRGFYGF